MENIKLETNEMSDISLKEEGKTTAIIAYITIIGLIVEFVMNNEKKNAFASYHIRQSLGVACTALAISLLSLIPYLGWIISFLGSFFILILWVKGLINALNLNEKPIPLLGEKFEEWFKDIK